MRNKQLYTVYYCYIPFVLLVIYSAFHLAITVHVFQ